MTRRASISARLGHVAANVDQCDVVQCLQYLAILSRIVSIQGKPPAAIASGNIGGTFTPLLGQNLI